MSATTITAPIAVDRVATWRDRDLAVTKLLTFLKAAGELGQKDWHVVFSCGTVARVKSTVPVQNSYPDARDAGYERIDDNAYLDQVIEDNRRTFEEQSTAAALTIEERKVVKQAYHMLYSDGYPYPGGDGADRGTQDVELHGDQRLYFVLWPARDINVFNLAVQPADQDGRAAVEGGELRRCDVIQPRVYCVISPQGTPTYM